MDQKKKNMYGASALLAAALVLSAPMASAALPTSGSCGLLLTMPVPYGSNSGTAFDYDVLATINFGTQMISANEVSSTYGNTQNAMQKSITGPFTTAAGPVSGSYTVTVSPVGGGTVVFNVLPVNGGNTFLVQETDVAAGGVCQMQ